MYVNDLYVCRLLCTSIQTHTYSYTHTHTHIFIHILMHILTHIYTYPKSDMTLIVYETNLQTKVDGVLGLYLINV